MKSNSKSPSSDQKDTETQWAFYFFMATVVIGVLAGIIMLLTF